MNDFETKQQAVLNYLLNGNGITSWEAYDKFYATRLSAIIFNLREMGLKIDDEWEAHNKSRYKRYFCTPNSIENWKKRHSKIKLNKGVINQP